MVSEGGPLGGPGAAAAARLAGRLGLPRGLGLRLRLGEVLLGLLGRVCGGSVTLGLELVLRRGHLGGVRGLGYLGGQVGREGGQFERLRRLGSARRPGRGSHCHGAENATGNSCPHRDFRRAAAGLPVAAYVSGVGHGNNRYQGLLHTFKKRVLRHNCSTGTPNPPPGTLY